MEEERNGNLEVGPGYFTSPLGKSTRSRRRKRVRTHITHARANTDTHTHTEKHTLSFTLIHTHTLSPSNSFENKNASAGLHRPVTMPGTELQLPGTTEEPATLPNPAVSPAPSPQLQAPGRRSSGWAAGSQETKGSLQPLVPLRMLRAAPALCSGGLRPGRGPLGQGRSRPRGPPHTRPAHPPGWCPSGRGGPLPGETPSASGHSGSAPRSLPPPPGLGRGSGSTSPGRGQGLPRDLRRR